MGKLVLKIVAGAAVLGSLAAAAVCLVHRNERVLY